MTEKELFDLLEIEDPAEVEYFEQMADLLETDLEIPEGLFRLALSKITPENAGEFMENYINDFLEAIPEGADAEDLTGALNDMQQRLMLLAEDLEDEQARADFCSELYKLRAWLQEENGTFLDGSPASMLEAFTEMRAEKLGLVSHEYRFDVFPALVPEELSYNLGAFEKIEI